MNNKIYKRKITVPIYEAVVNLCIVERMEDMQEYLDKRVKGAIDVLGAVGCVFDMFTKNGPEYFIVFMGSEVSHNLIAHEVHHLAIKITRDINITDEETTAWLVGYLTENLYKILKKRNYNIDQ